MWKIFIEYDDKSKLTLTGKHKDIPVELASKYYIEYVKSSVCNAIYQQYPKKDHEPNATGNEDHGTSEGERSNGRRTINTERTTADGRAASMVSGSRVIWNHKV